MFSATRARVRSYQCHDNGEPRLLVPRAKERLIKSSRWRFGRPKSNSREARKFEHGGGEIARGEDRGIRGRAAALKAMSELQNRARQQRIGQLEAEVVELAKAIANRRREERKNAGRTRPNRSFDRAENTAGAERRKVAGS